MSGIDKDILDFIREAAKETGEHVIGRLQPQINQMQESVTLMSRQGCARGLVHDAEIEAIKSKNGKGNGIFLPISSSAIVSAIIVVSAIFFQGSTRTLNTEKLDSVMSVITNLQARGIIK